MLVLIRIIPTLAGNTELLWSDGPKLQDHPHSRGEYTGPWGVVKDVRGSSPLSRGILDGTLEIGKGLRIIPTLAGNTPQEAPTRL